MVKNSIDFTPFGVLGGVPKVEWSISGKTGSLHATILSARYDYVLKEAIDEEGLEEFVSAAFYQQKVGDFQSSHIGSAGPNYFGRRIGADTLPVLARGIALYYIMGLQVLMATKPDNVSCEGYHGDWKDDVRRLRSKVFERPNHQAIVNAHLALGILDGNKREGQRIKSSGPFPAGRFLLVPGEYSAYVHDAQQELSR